MSNSVGSISSPFNISTTLSISNALISKLASAAAASAQTMANYRLQLVGNDLTAQLNKKIAALQRQSQDPTANLLQQQEAALNTQYQSYVSAETQIGQNRSVLGDLSLQLSNVLVAAQSGNAATFDTSLQAAQNDVATLQVVPFTPGLQDDGIASLKYHGLAIQSSSAYPLSTPAGQAQAVSDTQAAQALVTQITNTAATNQQISASIQQALQTQMNGVSTQLTNLQTKELSDAAAQIAKLKQQTQTAYHLIELNFGNIGQTASILTARQTAAQAAAVPPGTVLSILVGGSPTPTLFSANLTTTPTPTAGSGSGQLVSTSA